MRLRVIVYGRNPVREALRGKREVSQVWATRAAARRGCGASSDRVAPRARAAVRVPEHQGICAEAGPYPYADADSLLDDPDALVVCLDEVQDPHNLGAVCRVAEAAGAAGVVIPERRSAEVTPAACKASAGAVEHLAVARVRNLADWLAEAKERGAWVYGAAAEPAVPYDQPDYRGRVVLVLGLGGAGAAPARGRQLRRPDRPAAARASGSLNVSTAAAALVYGILHFRAAGLDRGP